MNSLQSLVWLERCAVPNTQKKIIEEDPVRIEEVSRLLDIMPISMICDENILCMIDAYALKEDIRSYIEKMNYGLLMSLLKFLINAEKERKLTRSGSSSDIACDIIDAIEDEIIKR